MNRILQWSFVAIGPFAIMAGYFSLSRSFTGRDADLFDFVALAVSVSAGAGVLSRLTRPDPAFWLLIYVPVMTLGLLFWSLVLVCGTRGNCL
jgi:hypothetical protein